MPNSYIHPWQYSALKNIRPWKINTPENIHPLKLVTPKNIYIHCGSLFAITWSTSFMEEAFVPHSTRPVILLFLWSLGQGSPRWRERNFFTPRPRWLPRSEELLDCFLESLSWLSGTESSGWGRTLDFSDPFYLIILSKKKRIKIKIVFEIHKNLHK